jgi:four helix bundle protein
MTNNQVTNEKRKNTNFDLEKRTDKFAKKVRDLLIGVKRDTINIEYIRQLTRSSGSVAANYIEANEAFSKKDFALHIKICRKEAKESAFWLNMLIVSKLQEQQVEALVAEAIELKKIFNTIVNKAI